MAPAIEEVSGARAVRPYSWLASSYEPDTVYPRTLQPGYCRRGRKRHSNLHHGRPEDRIARFTGDIDNDRGKSFREFISKSLGKIIYIKSYTAMDRGLYDGHLKLSDYCNDGTVCGGVNIFFNDFDKESTAFVNHGTWGFQGYYLVSGGGFAMGFVEYALKPIDEQEIVMSPKFDTD